MVTCVSINEDLSMRPTLDDKISHATKDALSIISSRNSLHFGMPIVCKFPLSCQGVSEKKGFVE